MSYEKIIAELHNFPDREKNLRSVTRYSLYHTVWYRTDLWTHSRRVGWIVEQLNPIAEKIFGENFDSEKAFALGMVHDDAETIFGDIQAGYKANMTKEELEEVGQLERNAIKTLASKSPKYIGLYEYETLLHESLNKPSLESIIVDWADKLDGFCEALHEIFAENTLFTENVIHKEYGKILLPTDHYMNCFKNFTKKFPKSTPLFEQGSALFKIPEYPDVKSMALNRRPHTTESIKQKKGYEPYDFWIQLTLQNGTPEDISNLYMRKE